MDCCEDYDKHCLPSNSLVAEGKTPCSSRAKWTIKQFMLKPRATLSPIKETDLFSSENVTGQVLTSSLIMKSLHISPSPPYKQVESHSTIKATILSSFPNQQQPSTRMSDGDAYTTVIQMKLWGFG